MKQQFFSYFVQERAGTKKGFVCFITKKDTLLEKFKAFGPENYVIFLMGNFLTIEGTKYENNPSKTALKYPKEIESESSSLQTLL